MTRDQFGALSFERQMGFVENYFKDRGFRANKPTNIADLYTAVSGYGYRKGSAAYELNSVWDTNRNNVIEKGEMVEAPEFNSIAENISLRGSMSKKVYFLLITHSA